MGRVARSLTSNQRLSLVGECEDVVKHAMILVETAKRCQYDVTREETRSLKKVCLSENSDTDKMPRWSRRDRARQLVVAHTISGMVRLWTVISAVSCRSTGWFDATARHTALGPAGSERMQCGWQLKLARCNTRSARDRPPVACRLGIWGRFDRKTREARGVGRVGAPTWHVGGVSSRRAPG